MYKNEIILIENDKMEKINFSMNFPFGFLVIYRIQTNDNDAVPL